MGERADMFGSSMEGLSSMMAFGMPDLSDTMQQCGARTDACEQGRQGRRDVNFQERIPRAATLLEAQRRSFAGEREDFCQKMGMQPPQQRTSAPGTYTESCTHETHRTERVFHGQTSDLGSTEFASSNRSSKACPSCVGKGAFDVWGKPCSETDMHFEQKCQLCLGRSTISGSSAKCCKCKGL